MFSIPKDRKFRFWSGIIVIVLLVLGLYFLFSRNSGPVFEAIIVQKGELIQEVNITGKIKSAQSVDLQFENSGRIAAINYKAGDDVNLDVIIASLENQDARAQVLEKEAELDSVIADSDKTKRNLSSLNDPTISTALKTDLDNARKNLENVKTKAADDIVAKYKEALNLMNEAMTQANSSFIVIKNIRKTYFDDSSEDSRKIQAAEKLAGDELFGIEIYGRLGADDYVYTANSLKTDKSIDDALEKLESGLVLLRNAYSILQTVIQSSPGYVSSTDRDKVNTEANNVSSELSGIIKIIQGINSQKITNEKAVSDAEQTLAKAETAFPTPEDILQKESAVKQARAALLSAQSQLRKTLIIAPFGGVISRVDANHGETVSSSDVIVSMISGTGYQIEANITEIDISKVKIGNEAKLTLDAYGSEAIFDAVVSNIDPGETIIDGVTTYKTIFDFITGDERLRPNMTANVNIITNKREDVIAIPQRAIIIKEGEKFIKVEKNGVIEEIKVQTGLSGMNGMIEILNGLNVGDKVVIFLNN